MWDATGPVDPDGVIGPVVLKVLNRQEAWHGDAWPPEATVWRDKHHRNVIRMLADPFRDDNGNWVLVLERADETLRQRLLIHNGSVTEKALQRLNGSGGAM